MTHHHHPTNGWRDGAVNDDVALDKEVHVRVIFDSRPDYVKAVVFLGTLLCVFFGAVGVGLFLLIPVLWRMLPWS